MVHYHRIEGPTLGHEVLYGADVNVRSGTFLGTRSSRRVNLLPHDFPAERPEPAEPLAGAAPYLKHPSWGAVLKGI